eukprot:TRINITY_DN4760_c0_g1_i1.p1 TRINITY_DN4760_c0_g1~~TRINITY_DN4760_c0_g1_i1.p1  ORF type:complete len:317 (+),score=49.07 TRINITY_DN4760_c0_g1_i1:213-1163(+)
MASIELILIGAYWYLTGCLSVLSSRMALQGLHAPMLLSLAQFVMVVSLGLFSTEVLHYPRRVLPSLRAGGVRLCIPLAVLNVLGTVCGYLSYAYLESYFVATLKATHPLFALTLSPLAFGSNHKRPPFLVVLPVVLIVVGVGLSSFQELDNAMDVRGIALQLFSIGCYALQNLLAKDILTRPSLKGTPAEMKPFSLLLCMNTLALVMMAGVCSIAHVLRADGVADFQQVHTTDVAMYMVAGAAVLANDSGGFALISLTTPLSYSIVSVLKRVVVVVASALYFDSTISATNAAGIALSMLGAFLFSSVNRRFAAKQE